MIGLVKRFREMGVDFAFPAQVSYLAGADGRIVEPHPAEGASGRPAALGGARKSAQKG
jgi:hypothetical protein